MDKIKPRGLIKNNRLVPKEISTSTPVKNEKIEKKKKKVAKNQDQNIKVSLDTKNQLDILMKLANTKFGYEIIELLIDYYVENGLEPDKKRAFKALTNL